MLTGQESFSTVEDRQKKKDDFQRRYDFSYLTVEQVARNYQVPISWLGDALVNFGVTPPIQVGRCWAHTTARTFIPQPAVSLALDIQF